MSSAVADATHADQVTSIWQLKPWWCQPWSILLTGLTAVVISWVWLKLWWLSGLVAVAVLLWWGLFLVLVPRAWSSAIQTEDGNSRQQGSS